MRGSVAARGRGTSRPLREGQRGASSIHSSPTAVPRELNPRPLPNQGSASSLLQSAIDAPDLGALKVSFGGTRPLAPVSGRGTAGATRRRSLRTGERADARVPKVNTTTLATRCSTAKPALMKSQAGSAQVGTRKRAGPSSATPSSSSSSSSTSSSSTSSSRSPSSSFSSSTISSNGPPRVPDPHSSAPRRAASPTAEESRSNPQSVSHLPSDSSMPASSASASSASASSASASSASASSASASSASASSASASSASATSVSASASATSALSSATVKYQKNCPRINTHGARSSLELLERTSKDLRWRAVSVPAHRLHSYNPPSAAPVYHWVETESSQAFSSVVSHLRAKDKVNKFPGSSVLSGKVELAQVLERARSVFPGDDDYGFVPRTFTLPHQWDELSAYADAQDKLRRERIRVAGVDAFPKEIFIVKPSHGAQGDGIYLVDSLRDVRAERECVVQSYVDRPLLIGGLKFDLRLYVLLVSVNPPVAYVYREGLARFCTEPYEAPNRDNMRKVYMHLTNYSLNKLSDGFKHSETLEAEDGSKRTLTSVLECLAAEGRDVEVLWRGIMHLVQRTVIAMCPVLADEYNRKVSPDDGPASRSYQVFGFDVMLDAALRPWLLEINSNPSLRLDYEEEVSVGVFESRPSPMDEHIKMPMFRDALTLVEWHRIAAARARRRSRSSGRGGRGRSGGGNRNGNSNRDSSGGGDSGGDSGGGDSGGDGDGGGGDSGGDGCPCGGFEPCEFGRPEDLPHFVFMDALRVFEANLAPRNKGLMSSTKFTRFARRFNLRGLHIQPADLDIIYLSTLRKSPREVRPSQMGLTEFFDAIFELAPKIYAGVRPDQAFRNLVAEMLQSLDKTGP